MNGWLRLWIVLSAFWLVPSSYFAYAGLSELYGEKEYEIANPNGLKFSVVFSKAETPEMRAVLKDYGSLLEKDRLKYSGARITEPYESYIKKHSEEKITRHAALILLPPLTLFLVGLSVVWIRKGFAK